MNIGITTVMNMQKISFIIRTASVVLAPKLTFGGGHAPLIPFFNIYKHHYFNNPATFIPLTLPLVFSQAPKYNKGD